MSNLVSAIIQAERYGVPIGQALRTQSEDLKRHRSQFMREQVMKAPVKMMVPMAILIMPALLFVLGGPLVIEFLRGGLF
jgi:tight adherence protein C